MPLIQTTYGALFYATRGDHGPALVFLHGAGGTHQNWVYQLNGLSDIARVFALDLPGHGRSAGPGYERIADFSAALVAALDALGLERAVLAGHSMGGAVALWTALEQPARVAGLALIGTGSRLRVPGATIDGLERNPQATIDALMANFYARSADPALRAAGEEAFRNVDPHVFRSGFVACDNFDVTARLGEIPCPTLVLCGDEDRMTPPKYSQFLREHIAAARLVLIASAGHMVMLEQPDEVNAALREFLRR